MYLYLEFGTLTKIEKLGYKNKSDFIRQAINEKIERESKKEM
jgi:metal-responsive CopG/Arc/MetJ family transcriptional regulator